MKYYYITLFFICLLIIAADIVAVIVTKDGSYLWGLLVLILVFWHYPAPPKQQS